MRKRILKIAAVIVAILIVAFVGAGFWLRSQIAGSLPQLDGEIAADQLATDVTIERDSLGIPTIRAANRTDLAFATGFVHAQDRFFQMDLLRRNSAGELAEVVGAAVVAADRRVRVHRFRDVAQRVLAAGGAEDRALVEAYAKGVNAGLASLGKKPFEYLLLGQEPAAWQPEDSALVMFSMYLDLQGKDFADEAALGLLHEQMGPTMFDFLAPRGTEWDAPIEGEAFSVPATPGPDVFDTRKPQPGATKLPPRRPAPLATEPLTTETATQTLQSADHFHPGSNNWAVSGKHTTDGRALLADDMHLGIRVPHIWYRASFVWPDENGTQQQATGATLPGTPAIIVGSNGHVAWGFTNAEGDWVDVVIVENDPADNDAYLTPEGSRKFEHHEETIKINGAADQKLDVVSTIWGPIVDYDHQKRPRVIRWVAHDTEGVNMRLLGMESTQTLEDALQLANLSGSPAQNFVVADDQGRIAWTIVGRIPKRVGFDGHLPTSWADGSRRWSGYLAPEEYPRRLDPEGGRIWTANARVVGGESLAKLGDGGYDLGARAGQIRDDLLSIDQATEADMLKIQLDDRAVFLERWRKLLLDTVTPEAIKADPRRAELRKFVDDWGGRAAVDSVGFRVVRAFRHRLLAQISDALVAPCKQVDLKFSIADFDRTEGPVWQLIAERPQHLLDPSYKSWDAILLSAVDTVLDAAGKDGGRLADFTWGRYNTTRIQHPLSLAVPQLSGWLDMVAQPLSGDTENMPRIQGPTMGASQRLAVSPGHEQDGYFHMPVGQSGHPMSPHYADAHAAWADGKATPFLPGAAKHKLVLKASPAAQQKTAAER